MITISAIIIMSGLLKNMVARSKYSEDRSKDHLRWKYWKKAI